MEAYFLETLEDIGTGRVPFFERLQAGDDFW